MRTEGGRLLELPGVRIKVIKQHGIDGGQARALRIELNTGNAPAGERVGLRRHVGGTGNLQCIGRVQEVAQGVKGLSRPSGMRNKGICQQLRSRKTKLRERSRKADRETHRPVGPGLCQHVGRRRCGHKTPSSRAGLIFRHQSRARTIGRYAYAELRQIIGEGHATHHQPESARGSKSIKVVPGVLTVTYATADV